ncbi:hypothetical protein K469DRAFT_693793 [Zopfia rhizophila CBS 207.26]|uniref:Uncharacterized protein n=1 Tax=Zopfia rhizophila CBS 207.26 TaxID=1314779 RepID=A0A6A6DNE7_9PEZI|nr:hypothetical protein K469DRAFT_693793 [Zopfia rhizophila CBS 207.26]
MPHTHEIDLPTRAAIVTLRTEGKGWVYISQKVANCSPNGAQQFFERVLQRSPCDPDHLNLPLLLKHLNDETNRGREERFPEGSAVEERLVQTALMDEEHEDMPHCRVIRIVEAELNIRIQYSTGHEVLKKAEIVKTVPPQKIYLDWPHRVARVFFAKWALGKLQLRVQSARAVKDLSTFISAKQLRRQRI